MRTFYVVDETAIQSLPAITRTAAIIEFKRLFAFVGQIPRQQPISTKVLVPSAFPEKFDLSDAVIRLTNSKVSTVGGSIRQQSKYVSRELKKQRVIFPITGRISVRPETGGQASQLKLTPKIGPKKKLAIVIMAGEVFIPAEAEDYRHNFPVTRRQIEKRRNFDDGNGGVDLGKMAKYFSSSRALRDTRYLTVLDNPKDISKWPSVDQQTFGVGLGRTMAHEVRHEIVAKPIHAATGLGASAPDIWDSKNYGNFSNNDKKTIVKALVTLEASQKGATVVPTYPNSVRSNPDSFPF